MAKPIIDATKGANTAKSDVDGDPVIAELRKSLLNESQRVSSASSGLESTISEAISNTRQAGASEATRIESAFGRQRTEGLRTGEQGVTAFAESRGGFATSLAGLRNLVHETDIYLKDLDQRKEEALMANNTNMLNSINGMILKGEEMKMEALQNTFNNLVQVTNTSIQSRQFELGQAESTRQFDASLKQSEDQFDLTYELEGKKFQLQKDMQSTQERQVLANIGLEFGLEVTPGDNIDSMVNKAAATGQVSQRKALELQQLRSEINRANAQAAEAARGNQIRSLDNLTKDMFAEAYRKGNVDILKAIENPNELGDVLNRASKQNEVEINNVRELIKSKKGSSQDIISEILNDPSSFTIPENQLTQMVNDELGARAAQEFLLRKEQTKSNIDRWMGGFKPLGGSGKETWS